MSTADPVTERARARVGTVLRGKWRLDGVVGVGGMATVYAATHRNQARVAIKVLHSEIALEPEVKERFLREGYVANFVEHAGTAKVLDDDVTEDGAPFLVMELLEGETVEARWERKHQRLPLSEAMAIADQILEVLAAAHAKGIVHRDLKPENLFLTKLGELKILDFGIARLREVQSEPSTRTRAGALLGTPAFMAPEQARGRWDDVDARTDIWALGATLFTLLAGRFVHCAETIQEQLIVAATELAPSIGTVTSGLPASVVELVDRALAFDKNNRWPDARAMQAALRASVRPEDAGAPLTLPVPSLARAETAATIVAPANQSFTTARPVTQGVQSGWTPARRSAAPFLVVGGLVLALGSIVAWRCYLAFGVDADLPVAAAHVTPTPDVPATEPAHVHPQPEVTGPVPATESPASATPASPPPVLRGRPNKPTTPPKVEQVIEKATPKVETAPPPAVPPKASSNPYDRRF